MVPEGWSTELLSNAGINVIDGDRGTEYPKATDFTDTGYCLFLSAKNVTKNGFLFDEVQFIGKHKHEKLRKGHVNRGSIVLTTRGTVGQFAYYDASVPYDVMRINSGMVILDCSDAKLTPEFLYAACRSNIVGRQIQAASFGSAQPQLTVAIIKKLKLPVPPKPEQKKIAQILSTWDKAIATTEKLLENSQKQKQALMQQLLTGKKRFPGFNEKWTTKSLGQIGEIKSAGVDKNIIEGEKPVRLLNFTDVFNKSFIYSNELNHLVTAPDAKILSCDVKKGDVFFTPSSETRNDAGIPAVAAEDIDDCCYSYHVVRFRLKEEWDLNFKAYIFTTPEFRKQACMLADGSGQRYVISQDGFRSIKITYPSYQEQVLIGKAIKAAEDEVNLLKQKIFYFKEEKKALMQQLLTGKRRVGV